MGRGVGDLEALLSPQEGLGSRAPLEPELSQLQMVLGVIARDGAEAFHAKLLAGELLPHVHRELEADYAKGKAQMCGSRAAQKLGDARYLLTGVFVGADGSLQLVISPRERVGATSPLFEPHTPWCLVRSSYEPEEIERSRHRLCSVLAQAGAGGAPSRVGAVERIRSAQRSHQWKMEGEIS